LKLQVSSIFFLKLTKYQLPFWNCTTLINLSPPSNFSVSEYDVLQIPPKVLHLCAAELENLYFFMCNENYCCSFLFIYLGGNRIVSYPNFWPKVLHSYTFWSWIVSDFSVKNSAKSYFKIPLFVPIRTLFSFIFIFYLLLSFKIPSFINSLLFLILILILISHFSFFYVNHFYFSFY